MTDQTPWQAVASEADLAAFKKAGMGQSRCAGSAPALLIVDMSYGFVSDDYPLGCGESGWSAVASTRELLDVARRESIPVFFTTGYQGDAPAGRGRWKGTIYESDAPLRIVSELEPKTGEVILRKRRPSAFFGTDLVGLLIFEAVDTLVICGATTSGCVRASVVDAFSYNLHVVVPSPCVADRSLISHQVALMDIQMKYGEVVDLTWAKDFLQQSPRDDGTSVKLPE